MKKRTLWGDIKNTFVSIAKGLSITFSHIFRKKVTVMYPEEKIEVQPAFRGMVSLPVNPETGTDECIGCGACQKICPEGIIKIKTEVDENKKRKVVEFEIDFSRCMWCGLCTEVCPKTLTMSHHYEAACDSRGGMVYNRCRLNEIVEPLPVKEKEAPERDECEGKKEAEE
jgi:NADH-quinone oxidoreductase subunit I